MQDESKQKIMLATLPFWTPLIPSQGIASLKSFLQKFGYPVRAVDAAVETRFLQYYDRYFGFLRENIPYHHRGNFYNIGHDVLRNHMMAHINYENRKEYEQLVKILVARTYYCDFDDRQIAGLIDIVDRYFDSLREYFLDFLEREKPDVLGLSANSGNLASTYYIFRLAKETLPAVTTVMGGCVFFNHLAIGNPDLEFFLEKTGHFLDKIIIGKGEVLFLKFLRGELALSRRVYTQEDLDETALASYAFDIPDLSDFDLQKYFYLAASGSTSCPYRCSFCNSRTFFGEYRKKDPGQTVQEMKKLQDRYRHKLFFMTDALLNPVITGLAEEIIRQELTVYMDGYFTVDNQSGDIENTLLWRRGGFYRARLGVESGSQKVLDLIGKKINPEIIRAAVSGLAYAGIKTTTYWVVGHPGETEADFQQTLDLVEELRDDIWQAECNPFTYFYVGQTNSEKWGEKRRLLYPEKFRDMLISQTWIVDCSPTREEIYDRVFRFVEHCQRLGIPNPYTLSEIYEADQRWKNLHKNAVPSVVELINPDKNVMGDRENVRKFLRLQDTAIEDGDFAL